MMGARMTADPQQMLRAARAGDATTLAQLPNDYREVLVLRHLEGLTFPEIACLMERSLDSVEKLWMRGLARLRQLMGDGT
jgi:DNA-directed RNA polymerase specialized sigma24 family protein